MECKRCTLLEMEWNVSKSTKNVLQFDWFKRLKTHCTDNLRVVFSLFTFVFRSLSRPLFTLTIMREEESIYVSAADQNSKP